MVDPVSVGSVSLTGDLRRRQTGRKMFVAHIKHFHITIRKARMQQLDSADINIKHWFAKFDVLTHQVLHIFIPRETMPSTKSPEPGRQKKGRFSTGVRIFLISLREKKFWITVPFSIGVKTILDIFEDLVSDYSDPSIPR